MAKLPFMKFFPKDWMGDDRLRLCSVAARGLWIDLLCLMHSAPRRGYLQTATGAPLPLEQIARMAGCSTDEASRLLQELVDAGVCDRAEHGLIYSRRMVREGDISQVRSDAGKRGGNPRLVKQTGSKPEAKGQANDKPPEVQKARGSEGQSNTPQPPAKPGGGKSSDEPPGFAEFWTAYPHKVDKPAALRAWVKLNPDETLRAAILAGLKRYKANKPDWQAWKHPGPWLNARKWEDQPAETSSDGLTSGGDDRRLGRLPPPPGEFDGFKDVA